MVATKSSWTLVVLVAFLFTALFVNARAAAAVADQSATEELSKLFEQDQSERSDVITDPKPGQWARISAHDKERRARVLDLLRQDKLKSADDYYYAAMIMQHGNEPRAFTLAHIFAMAAAQRGRKGASWLSAASLDRLLQSAGQPQVFGTQYYSEGNQPYTISQPFQADIITDAVRRAFDVPSLTETEQKLEELNSKRKDQK